MDETMNNTRIEEEKAVVEQILLREMIYRH